MLEIQLKQRMLWALRKHRSALGNITIIDSDRPPADCDIDEVAEFSIGLPVACSFIDSMNWTLLGTRSICGKCKDVRACVEISEISEIGLDDAVNTNSPNRETISPKIQSEPRLRVRDCRDQSHYFAFSAPDVLFAFWNLLQRRISAAKNA